jgi:hypothetical protein
MDMDYCSQIKSRRCSYDTTKKIRSKLLNEAKKVRQTKYVERTNHDERTNEKNVNFNSNN